MRNRERHLFHFLIEGNQKSNSLDHWIGEILKPLNSNHESYSGFKSKICFENNRERC